MRFLLFAITCSFVFYSCNHTATNSNTNKYNSDSTFTLSGLIKGADTGSVVIVHKEVNTKIYDTVTITKGSFTYAGKLQNGTQAFTVYLANMDEDRLDILVENTNIKLVAIAGKFTAAEVTGSAAQVSLIALQKQVTNLSQAMKEIDRQASEAELNGTLEAIGDSLFALYDVKDSLRQLIIATFAIENPTSIASAYAVSRNLLYSPKVEIIEPIYAGFDSVVKQSIYGKVINEVLASAKKTAIGQLSPDFTMNDTKGKPVALSSFRGTYLLLDFWASWCGPCRKENPNVVKCYNKFRGKKFTILGVSLDDDKADWLTAIAKDKLDWNQVSDLKGWGCEAAKLYGVRGIPTNLLLDKEGRIIAKNLRGEELAKKLEEVIK